MCTTDSTNIDRRNLVSDPIVINNPINVKDFSYKDMQFSYFMRYCRFTALYLDNNYSKPEINIVKTVDVLFITTKT